VGIGWDAVEHAVLQRSPGRPSEAFASRAAVALILRDGVAGIEILFIRRADHPQDPWSGQMAFPGGRAEPGENDLVATAIRETREEVGIDLHREAVLLGALDEVRAMARLRPVDLAISPFVFRLRSEATPEPGPEVRSVHWIQLSRLLAAGARSTFDYTHQGATLQFPCLRLGDEELVIWGLTYRMFMSFGDRLIGTDEAAASGAGG
jgi:8-oxo-dGTP pyrophosphatase MutT (NUDIX family)